MLGLSQPGTVRLVDRLAEEGLVERRPGGDRRTLALFTTARGRAAARQVLAARAHSLRDLLELLDADERARLVPLLEKLASGLAQDRPQALTSCRLCDRAACAQGPGCPLVHTVADPGRAASNAGS